MYIYTRKWDSSHQDIFYVKLTVDLETALMLYD